MTSMTDIEANIKNAIADHGIIKMVLTVLFAALSVMKSRSWFSKKPTAVK